MWLNRDLGTLGAQISVLLNVAMIVAAVPTHVITGFLGSGKTTFIKALLQAKPVAETWAVLVNEFGEIGIDASLMGSRQDVVIREVAGGCICCAAGVPLQVAVTQLLAKAKPQRLLIEPTGLGHPLQIIRTLQSQVFAQSIRLLSSVCLLDPRKLADNRYLTNDTFVSQLASADILLASKADLWQQQAEVQQQLQQFVTDRDLNQPLLQWSQQQPLPPALWSLLQHPAGVTTANRKVNALLQPTPDYTSADNAAVPFNAQGFVFKAHQDAHAYSYGWKFSPQWVFDLAPLVQWISSQQLLRLKAVMITSDGIAAFNMLDGELSFEELDEAMDSRLELISQQPLDALAIEQQLLSLGRMEL